MLAMSSKMGNFPSILPAFTFKLCADCGRGLIAHQVRARGVEVHGVLVEILMLCHERVLLVDRDVLRMNEGLRDGVAGVDTAVCRAVEGFGLHWSNRGPDEPVVRGHE